MIAFDKDAGRFNYRVAGICIHDGYVLLHRADRDHRWALPGGRCEFGETSDAALRREMREELAVEATVGMLLWIVENFFALSDMAYHELAFLYAIDLPVNNAYLEKTVTHLGIEAMHADEKSHALMYEWLPVAAVSSVNLYPAFLRTALQNLPTTTQRVVQRDA